MYRLVGFYLFYLVETGYATAVPIACFISHDHAFWRHVGFDL